MTQPERQPSKFFSALALGLLAAAGVVATSMMVKKYGQQFTQRTESDWLKKCEESLHLLENRFAEKRSA